MRILHRGGPFVGLVLAAISLAPAHAAEAQTIPSSYRFIDRTHDAGIVAGYAQEGRGDLGIGPGGGPFFGARYAIELTGPLAAELAGYVLSTDRVVYQVTPGTGLVRRGTADMAVFAVEGRLRFTLTGDRTWRGLAPFVTAGGGVAGNLVGASRELEVDLPLTDRVNFGPTALFLGGVGTRWIPGDRVTFRAEVLSNVWRQGVPPGFFEVEEELGGLSNDEWLHHGSVLLSVTYRF